jgi:hypothetical protein
MFKSNLVSLIVGIVVVTLASQTWANPVSFVNLGHFSSVSLDHNGSTMNVNAGEILIDYNAIRLTAYCVDLDHWLKNSWDANPASVSTVNGGLEAAWLYDHFAGSVTTNAQAAGLQIAIWEVVDDSGSSFSLNDGNFRLTGSATVAAAAQGYLNALPADLSGYTTSSFIVESGINPRSQNLIVPEPACLVLLATALPIMILGRRR